MSKAIFIDRDGVINPLVINPATGEYESPRRIEDFALYPFVEKSLFILRNAGYIIVLVSNQPDYAKGKSRMEPLLAIAGSLNSWSDEHGGLIDKHCYCYHHPDGVVPDYSYDCECRKPGTLFLEQSKEQFNLSPALCWFIGDRSCDMECGRRFGCRTLKINNIQSIKNNDAIHADYIADNLMEGARMIAQSLRGRMLL